MTYGVQNKALHDPNPLKDSAFPLLASTVTNGRQAVEREGFDVIHWHDDVQLVCVENGLVEVTTLEGRYKVGEGAAIFINSAAPHRIHLSHMRGSYSYLLAPPALLGFYPGSAMAEERVTPFTAPGCDAAVLLDGSEPWHAEAIALLRTAISAVRAVPEGQASRYEAALRVVEFWYLFTTHAVLERRGGETDRKADRMRAFLSYIQTHFGEPISVEDIAAAGNVSKVECGRCFREAFGVSPHKYLAGYRIDRARALLREGRLDVTDVALACGFSSTSHFSNAFRAATGMAPRAYRAQR